jgi:hypothetical protein
MTAEPTRGATPSDQEVEAQLARVFGGLDEWQVAPDLLDRVSASVVADDARRRRRRRGAIGIGVVAAAIGAAGAVASVVGGVGATIDWRILEVVQVLVMLALVVGLRPLLDAVGHDFLAAVFRGSERTVGNLAALLDLAWNLVFVGMVLVSVRWQPPLGADAPGAAQFDLALERIGGLVLAMGLLHGATFLALPVVGVVWTSATTGRPMPRWVAVLVAVIAVPVGLVVANLVVGLVVVGAGG